MTGVANAVPWDPRCKCGPVCYGVFDLCEVVGQKIRLSTAAENATNKISPALEPG
jgi:hypothetical protein